MPNDNPQSNQLYKKTISLKENISELRGQMTTFAMDNQEVIKEFDISIKEQFQALQTLGDQVYKLRESVKAKLDPLSDSAKNGEKIDGRLSAINTLVRFKISGVISKWKNLGQIHTEAFSIIELFDKIQQTIASITDLQSEAENFSGTLMQGLPGEHTPTLVSDAEIPVVQSGEISGIGDMIRKKEIPDDLAQKARETDREVEAFFEDFEDIDRKETKEKQIGKYTILKELGAGGMGKVYEARHPDGKVGKIALKALLPGVTEDKTQLAALRREFEVLMKLNHPNIVRVYEIGENYFTMEILSGGTLEDFFRENRGKPGYWRKVAEIMKKICDAVHLAHRNGIVHRDLKPTNIMFDAKDEPKVMDFGLAKLESSLTKVSKTGEIKGTPAYMSPEQLKAREKVGPQSDVWALGVILYEMLSGNLPFPGDNHWNVINQILTQEVNPPDRIEPAPIEYSEKKEKSKKSKKKPRLDRFKKVGRKSKETEIIESVPEELGIITTNCIEKKLHYRYMSTKQLGQDLQNYLEGDPLIAQPLTDFQKLLRILEKNSKIVAIIGTGIFTFMLVLIYANIAVYRAKRETEKQRDIAVLAKNEAETQRDAAKSANEKNRRIIDIQQDIEKARVDLRLGKSFSELRVMLGVARNKDNRNTLDGGEPYIPLYIEWAYFAHIRGNNQEKKDAVVMIEKIAGYDQNEMLLLSLRILNDDLAEASGVNESKRYKRSADRCLADIEALNKDNEYGIYARGCNESDPEKKIEAFSLAIEKNPAFIWPWYNRGNAYMRRANDSMKKAKTARNRRNANEAGQYRESALKDFELALRDFNKTIKIDPNEAKGFHGRGTVLLICDKAFGNNKQFRYNTYVKQNGNSPVDITNTNPLDQALGDFDQAIRLKPNYIKSYINKGHVYMRKRKYKKAENEYGPPLYFSELYKKRRNIRKIQQYIRNAKNKQR